MALRRLSTTALRAELARRERGASKLVAQRAKLARQIAALDAELADLGTAAPSRLGRPVGSKNKRRKPAAKRAKNKTSLADALAAAVTPGATVTVPQATKAVLASGYKTADKDFGATISRTLAAHKGFKRTGRGTYVRVGAKPKRKVAKRAAARKPAKRAARRKPAPKPAAAPGGRRRDVDGASGEL